MWGSDFENYGDILSACDFSQAALTVFKILCLTDNCSPEVISRSPLNFVYDNLPQNLVLSEDERLVIGSLEEIGYLFSITEFDDKEPSVVFFAVDIGTATPERSQIQHTVHSIISRESSFCSVVIFRCGEAISVSSALYKTQYIKTIYLSEWYESSSTEIDNFFISIGCEQFSSTNGIEFIKDFIYLTARGYYTHPLSFEYFNYVIGSDEEYLQQIEKQYGYDFVTDAFIEILNKKTDTSGEIDFDLIEYELEQLNLLNFDDEDDDWIDEESSEVQSSNNILIDDIPKEVLEDPVKLLQWIDEHSYDEQKEIKPDNSIIDLIIQANIEYIDHRSKGGRLWIFGSYELSEFVIKCNEIGFVFHFKEGGGKATDGFDAWWCY